MSEANFGSLMMTLMLRKEILYKVYIQRVEWESTQKQIEMKEKILLLLGDHKV